MKRSSYVSEQGLLELLALLDHLVRLARRAPLVIQDLRGCADLQLLDKLSKIGRLLSRRVRVSALNRHVRGRNEINELNS